MTQPTPAGSPPQGRRPIPMEPGMCPVANDWSRYSLQQIWAMLERQSPEVGHTAAGMWSFIERLCRELASQLAKALEDLEAHWPRTQHAAIMFRQWGESLVEAMECTAETARLNRPVVENITNEIGSARGKVAEIMGRAARYEELERMAVPAVGLPSLLTAGMPHLIEMGRELVNGDGLQLTGWRTSLSNQAREVMADLEQKIFDYSRGLHADPPYTPPVAPGVDPTDEMIGAGSGSGGPEGWGGGFAAGGGGWSSGGWTPPGGYVPPGDEGLPTGGPDASGAPGPEGSPGLDGETVLDGATPAGAGGIGAAGTAGSGGAFMDTPWGRVLAPGGVIGGPGSSGAGVAAPGGPGGFAGPVAARLTPGAGGRSPAGGGMVPIVPPMLAGQPGQVRPVSAGTRRGRRGLPSAFQTPAGPSGVIEPDQEPTDHDPGPGVIGIDR